MSASSINSALAPTPLSYAPAVRRLMLALSIGSVGAAGFPNLRLQFLGLLVPLHVVPLLLAVPVAFSRPTRIALSVRTTLLVFLFVFAVSVLRYGDEFGDLIKMAASMVTFVIVASLVRTKSDFLLGTVALAVAATAIGARGLQGGLVDNIGYEPMRGIANKNAYSIYALPAVLLASFALLHFRVSKTATGIFLLCILSSAFILFTGANRSGWAGIVIIAILLAAQARRWRALLLIGFLGLTSYGTLIWLGSTDTFEYRVDQTTAGNSSDEVRESLFLTALEIAIENPILGVTVQELPRELAKRTRAEGDLIDPHNFIGYIAGGTGLVGLVALLWFGRALWVRPARADNPNTRLAHDLVRMMIVLFVFRGFFSRELFFVAPFPIGLGLALGLTQVEDNENWSLNNEQRR